MVTLLILFLICLGAYAFYQTSRRASVNKSGLRGWFYNHPIAAKFISVFLFLTSGYLCVFQFGFAVGIFYSFVVLMTVSSLFVLLTPLLFNRRKQ